MALTDHQHKELDRIAEKALRVMEEYLDDKAETLENEWKIPKKTLAAILHIKAKR